MMPGRTAFTRILGREFHGQRKRHGVHGTFAGSINEVSAGPHTGRNAGDEGDAAEGSFVYLFWVNGRIISIAEKTFTLNTRVTNVISTARAN